MQESLMEKLGRDSLLHAQGEFTLEVGKASSKLARFQLEDPQDFLFQLVAGLIRVGATALEVKAERQRLSIRCSPLELPEQFPADFELEVFESESKWRRLAAASQSLLALAPEQLLWLGKRSQQQWNLLEGHGEHWKRPELCEIVAEGGGLTRKLLEGAQARLRERARYCRHSLKVQGKLLERVQVETSIGPWKGSYSMTEGHLSELVLVVDEMTTSAKHPDFGLSWQGLVYWDQPTARLDASLGSVVEDASYQELLACIPTTFPVCLLAHCQSPPVGPVSRALILDHLLPPLAPWASTIDVSLRSSQLFCDQRGVYWSLSALLQYNGPIYYSALPLAYEVEDLVLMEGDPRALRLLQIYLMDRFQEATREVLHSLRRETNRRRWSQQPVQSLSLPPLSWLHQCSEPGWVLGIAANWLPSGGSIRFLHEGRPLCERRLGNVPFAFTVVCEIEEGAIDALWEDVREDFFQAASEAWIQRCASLLSEQADSPGALSEPMLKALAQERDPRESFFARSLLFRDLQGRAHSLENLCTAQSVGRTIAFVSGKHPLPEHPELLPEALVLLVSGVDGRRALESTPGLGVRNFDVFLEDLARARDYAAKLPEPGPQALHWEQPEYRAWIELLPQGSGGKIQLVTRGIAVEPESVPSSLPFQARVYGDPFKLDIRTANFNRGIERYVPASRAPWRKCLEDVQSRVESALERALEAPSSSNRHWVRQLLLQGLAGQYPRLSQVPCLPTTQSVDCSLAEVLSNEPIFWTSAPPWQWQQAGLSERALQLPDREQEELEKHYGGNWQCLDERLARSAALQEFLKRPRLSAKDLLPTTVQPLNPPLQGNLLALARPTSRLVLLHRERQVCEQVLLLPGLEIHLECPAEWIDSEFKSATLPPEVQTEIAGQAESFLEGWLLQPRPYLGLQHWEALEAAGPGVAEAMLGQPWFWTNRGGMCWRELMAQTQLHLSLHEHGADSLPECPLILYTMHLPPGLRIRLEEQHPQLVPQEETRALVQQLERRRKQLAELESLQNSWKNHSPRLSISEPFAGLLVWNASSDKDFWRVSAGVRSPESRLPACLAGYVEADELQPEQLADILEAAVPLVEARLEVSPLNQAELTSLSEFCLLALPLHRAECLRVLRWIPCHDGCFTSLQQLRLQATDRGAVEFWKRNYPKSQSKEPIPLLTSTLMQEMVRTCCEVELRLLPAPWLYRSVGDVLREAVAWMKDRPGQKVVQALRGLWSPQQPVAEQSRLRGQALLDEIHKSAQLLLIDPAARKACLKLLQQSQIVDRGRLWKLDSRERLLFNPETPALQQGGSEAQALSVLLGLVCLANARSSEFTDEMEHRFLHQLAIEVVGAHRKPDPQN